MPPDDTFGKMCRDFEYLGVIGLSFSELPASKVDDMHVATIAREMPSIEYLLGGDSELLHPAPLTACQELKYLDIRVTRDSDMSFMRRLPKLKDIRLVNATVRADDLNNLRQLSKIQLIDSAIETRAFASVAALRELQIDNCELNGLILDSAVDKAATSINTLVVTGTSLTTFVAMDCKQLQSITLNRNPALLRASLRGCVGLTVLNINKNANLDTISIEDCGLPKQVFLTENNQVKYITLLNTLPTQELVLKSPPNLRDLQVSTRDALRKLNPEDSKWLSSKPGIVHSLDGKADKSP